MRTLPYGDAGLLVELDDLAQVLDLHDQVAALDMPGVVDLVPAACTLLVRLDPARTSVGAAASRIERLEPGRRERSAPELIEVPVVYGGPDLDEVGHLTGLGAQGVVAAHTGQRWTLAFAGFAPGFGYLIGEDERLVVPRRPAPRHVVPAGAVALADGYSGIYPRGSPGGWQLIGQTDVAVWDLRRDPPALLQPGTTVRFVDAG